MMEEGMNISQRIPYMPELDGLNTTDKNFQVQKPSCNNKRDTIGMFHVNNNVHPSSTSPNPKPH